MTTAEENLVARYRAAAHAMQSGVAQKMMKLSAKETEPKHLRVGINAAMSDQAGLVSLLITKGIITKEEYLRAIAEKMEEEQKSYEAELSGLMDSDVTLA